MLKNYLTTSNLFSTSAMQNHRLHLVQAGIFVLCIIVSVLLSLNKTIHKGLKDRLFNFFLTIGILGIFILFFQYEMIPYVGYRVMMLALVAVAVIWYFVITIYSLTKMPREIRIIKNHERYIQYLPKAKKK